MKSSAGTEYICGNDTDVQREVVDAEEAKIVAETALAARQKEAAEADTAQAALVAAHQAAQKKAQETDKQLADSRDASQ